MTRARCNVGFVAVFALGVTAGALAARKVQIGPSVFLGQAPASAASSLLGLARSLAEDGSYENLAVARVHYLAGQRTDGQAIIDGVMSGKVKSGDLLRVARIYDEAGEWERAKPLFDRVVSQAPEDEDWLAEIGARYLAHGERARAEELFASSLRQDPSNLYNALRMASGFLGVRLD